MLRVARGDALDQRALDRHVGLRDQSIVGFAPGLGLVEVAPCNPSGVAHPGYHFVDVNASHNRSVLAFPWQNGASGKFIWHPKGRGFGGRRWPGPCSSLFTRLITGCAPTTWNIRSTALMIWYHSS